MRMHTRLQFLKRVSNVAYSHGQEQAKKEKVYKEMTQLKSQIKLPAADF
uniref:CD209c antigen n=1 Tax=Mus musculus TaxID=10090 RepID=A0A140LIY5_MOUSE